MRELRVVQLDTQGEGGRYRRRAIALKQPTVTTTKRKAAISFLRRERFFFLCVSRRGKTRIWLRTEEGSKIPPQPPPFRKISFFTFDGFDLFFSSF